MEKNNLDWVSISLKPDDWENGRYVQEWAMKRDELYLVKNFFENLCNAIDTYLDCTARKEITVKIDPPEKGARKRRLPKNFGRIKNVPPIEGDEKY